MEPKTLKQAIEYFADAQNCREYLVAMRWPDGVECPTCGSKNVKFSEKHNRWQCASHHAKRQFTLKTGTVFEESPLGLDKWLMAMWMLVNCKNGVSSHEVAKDLGVTQKSAWFILHRLREALRPDESHMFGFGGPVESDETYIGPNPAKMHKDRKAKLQAANVTKGGFVAKVPVHGILDRELRQVRAKVLPNVKRETLQNEILKNVTPMAKVYTDEAVQYDGLEKKFVHKVVNHSQEYVRGSVHTQGIENFWSLLKRSLRGTYVAVEPFHLDAYVTEQVFRFNNRATKDNPLTDADRFSLAAMQIVGKRLTYAELTGKEAGGAEPF